VIKFGQFAKNKGKEGTSKAKAQSKKQSLQSDV
jgi:hypothetical protein